MTLEIDLPPELKEKLEQEAARNGEEPRDFARRLLEERLSTDGGGHPERTLGREPPAWEGLPRRSPADLEALAEAQGVKPLRRIEDLKADFWPEDETCDEFIAAVREWRRQG